MVSVEQSITTGYKLIWKYKKLVLVPIIMELIKLLLLELSFSLGGFGAGSAEFFLPFTLPKTWFTLDDILPLPILGPSLIGAFYPTLQLSVQAKMLVFFRIMPIVAISAYLKSGYLGWIKNIFAGEKLTLRKFSEQALKYFHRFFILELVVLISELLWWYIFHQAGSYAPFIQKAGIAVVHICFIFTSAWIVFGGRGLGAALKLSLESVVTYSQLIISYALWGALINGLVAIPINWAVGTLPGLLLSILIYAICGSGLSVGLMYLFAGLEYDPEWKEKQVKV